MCETSRGQHNVNYIALHVIKAIPFLVQLVSKMSPCLQEHQKGATRGTTRVRVDDFKPSGLRQDELAVFQILSIASIQSPTRASLHSAVSSLRRCQCQGSKSCLGSHSGLPARLALRYSRKNILSLIRGPILEKVSPLPNVPGTMIDWQV